MNLDMRKPLRNLTQMRVKSAVSAFAFPGRCDLTGCIAEDRAEPMFYLNGIAKLFFNGSRAGLRGVCPDTQDIREICSLDHPHLVFPLFSVALNVGPCRVISLRSYDLSPFVPI